MPISKVLGQIAPGTAVFTSIKNRIKKNPVGNFYITSLLGQEFFYSLVLVFFQLHTLIICCFISFL